MISIAKYSEQEKRRTISCLPLPTELLYLINDFVYHSENTSPTIQKVKKIKGEIDYLFTNCSSAKINKDIEEGEVIEDEYWWFNMTIPTRYISSQLYNIGYTVDQGDIDDYWPLSLDYDFSARNCKVCGDYKVIHWYNHDLHIQEQHTRGLTAKNTCKCLK